MFVRTESFSEFRRYYPVITALLFINIIVFILINFPGFLGNYILELVVGVNLLIMNGEVWRLVTAIFSHQQFSHLLFNCFSLVLFGPGLERILGKQRFLLVYFLTGISANIATLILKPPFYAHLGASGAIFGLFGYYISIVLFNKNLLAAENRQIIVTIVVISLIMTFFQGNINVTAHIFGMIAGFLIGLLHNRR